MNRRLARHPPPLPLDTYPFSLFEMRVALNTLLDFLYPRACLGCGGAVSSDEHHLCWDCVAGLVPVVDPYCEWCGDPVDGVVGHRYTCSMCRRHAPAFERARSGVRYRGAVRNALQRFKYNQDVSALPDLGRLLKACVDAHYRDVRLDAVAYVPLYPRRERRRTYNQSRLLAQELARAMGIPLATPRCLRRVRETGTQTGLNARQRRENVRNAFAVGDVPWIEGRRLLLIDDVMTTGATVSECARALKAAGAAGVHVASVARG